MNYDDIIEALFEIQDEAFRLGKKLNNIDGGIPEKVDPKHLQDVNKINEMAYNLAKRLHEEQ